MAHRDSEMLLGKFFESTSVEAVDGGFSDQKETYEKPVLTVVKFMFESDITWGSFDNNSTGDNEVKDPGEDWWS